MGHSWAADFMLYALFRRPALFQRYVAASATPSLDDEQAYSDSHRSLPVRLHLEMEDSNEEGVSGQRAFFDRLQDRSYTGLTVTQRVIPDCTHCAMVPAAFQSGLVRVFS